VIIFQEQIERESIAITLKASKLTSQVLAKALTAVAKQIKENSHKEIEIGQGHQSLRKLSNIKGDTSSIPIDGDKGLFKRVARKWCVDYNFKKTGKDKYLLLFKAGQADLITGCFSEYSAKVMERARNNRPSIMDSFRNASERAESEQPTQSNRNREREVVRE